MGRLGSVRGKSYSCIGTHGYGNNRILDPTREILLDLYQPDYYRRMHTWHLRSRSPATRQRRMGLINPLSHPSDAPKAKLAPIVHFKRVVRALQFARNIQKPNRNVMYKIKRVETPPPDLDSDNETYNMSNTVSDMSDSDSECDSWDLSERGRPSRRGALPDTQPQPDYSKAAMPSRYQQRTYTGPTELRWL